MSRGVFEQYNASWSNKQTKKYNIIISDAVCGVSSQPNTWLLCVTNLFLLCPINGSIEKEKSLIMEKADFPSINSKAASWPVCEEEFRKTGSTKWDMRHLLIWKCSGFASVSPWQKIFMATQSKRVGQQKSVFFSVLIVIVHVCLFTDGDLLCCGYEIKKWICCWNMDL